jgi:hypothetical protein
MKKPKPNIYFQSHYIRRTYVLTKTKLKLSLAKLSSAKYKPAET